MKLYEGKNNEIRKVMRKHSLRVNRLQRVKYGPYSLGMVPEPNDLVEVSVTEDIRAILYRYYKARAAEATSQLKGAENQKVLEEYELRQVEEVIGKENAAAAMGSGT
jgi:hypothetical protein